MLIFGIKTVGFLSSSFIVELPEITIDLASVQFCLPDISNRFTNNKLTHSSGTSPAADPIRSQEQTRLMTSVTCVISKSCHVPRLGSAAEHQN